MKIKIVVSVYKSQTTIKRDKDTGINIQYVKLILLYLKDLK